MKTIGYIRVSTSDQNLSPEGQANKIQRYCEYKETAPPILFYDHGISGAKISRRKEFIKAMETSASGDEFVVVKLDRLARSLSDLLYIRDEFVRKNVNLVSLTENIDTNSAVGRMCYNILGTFAEFEREMISERTKFGLQVKREKNEKLGGNCPYGYFEKDGQLISNGQEQTVLTIILDTHKDGGTYRGIANELNLRGYTNRQGRKFHPQTIKNIISYHS